MTLNKKYQRKFKFINKLYVFPLADLKKQIYTNLQKCQQFKVIRNVHEKIIMASRVNGTSIAQWPRNVRVDAEP